MKSFVIESILLLFGFIGAALIIILVVLSRSMISIDTIQEKSSPDHRFVAQVKVTNGGATTGFSYDVYLKPTKGVNFFNERLIASFENSGNVNLIWKSSKELQIDFVETKEVTVNPCIRIEGTDIFIKLHPIPSWVKQTLERK